MDDWLFELRFRSFAILANLQIYVKSILQKLLLPPDTAAIKGK